MTSYAPLSTRVAMWNSEKIASSARAEAAKKPLSLSIKNLKEGEKLKVVLYDNSTYKEKPATLTRIKGVIVSEDEPDEEYRINTYGDHILGRYTIYPASMEGGARRRRRHSKRKTHRRARKTRRRQSRRDHR